MLTNPVDSGESESTVLGPFYRENPPVLPKGASVVQKHFDNEETAYFEGYVRDTNGAPLEGVIMDVWEDAPNGLYENHDPDQPDYNLRGRLRPIGFGPTSLSIIFKCLANVMTATKPLFASTSKRDRKAVSSFRTAASKVVFLSTRPATLACLAP
jgi:hypothetical protein